MMGFLRTSIAVAVAGVMLGCSSSGGGTPRSSAPRPDPDLINVTEISSQPFRDGYDVVQRLRPTWFRSGIVVYLNNARMGGVGALRQFSANTIESLRFLDAATATATLPGIGSSVVTGAIVIRLQAGP